MLSVSERVVRYLAAIPPAISGDHGQDQTFSVACVLVHGWAMPELCALTWLRIYNERCKPKWELEDLVHKLKGAINADHAKPRGHLLGLKGLNGCTPYEVTSKPAVRPPIPRFDREAFRRFVAGHAPVDAEWLERRSPICPANQTPASFLRALYYKGEHVIIFDKLCSRWLAIWGHIGLACDDRILDRFAKGAQSGVWFLCNPVDGVWRLNREERWSLRSQENVTAWRYLVLESDRSDISAGEWLAFLVALELPIAAICETGGRLPHALVRVDAASKEGWDRIRDALAPLLIMGGADRDALSAVRLTRLPCCERLGREDEAGAYHKFPNGPHLQRLLYLNPQPTCTPILRLGLRPATGASKT
jgi:hypothetical protein